MRTRKEAKVEATCAVSSDGLSSLPLEMKVKILSLLTIEEAVRCSTLSSTWRNTWTDMPKVFLCDGNISRTKFVTLVDMVLSLHIGRIKEFDISGSKNYHDVFARWMLMLSRRSPSSIKIKLTSGPEYRIPSCLFSISYLEDLDLQNCIISLPRVFQGFKSLSCLNLEDFSSTDSDIQNLICFCPVLIDLRLSLFEGISCLIIQAPNLEYLDVDGAFEDIHLDAPNLEEATISLDKDEEYQSVPVVHDEKSFLNQSLGSLNDIKTLNIGGYFLTYLSKGRVPTKLPAVLDRLEYIRLTICFWDPREVLTACSLFQNAPNLKKVVMLSHPLTEDFEPITTRDHDQASIQELSLQMFHLVTVSVEDFLGLDYEVDFVGKLLSWAPALEEAKIEWKGEIDRGMVFKKLLALPRVSPKAKVIVT
uniref:Uncharacterized protein n=1 Tax=Avena sativa TaxID=4498 RepID=A0ACD5TI36_AVESA